MSNDPFWHGDITYVVHKCNPVPCAQGEHFIATLEVCSGTQANTARCLILHVVSKFMIIVCFDIGAESEIEMIVIHNIMSHDNVAWGVNI